MKEKNNLYVKRIPGNRIGLLMFNEIIPADVVLKFESIFNKPAENYFNDCGFDVVKFSFEILKIKEEDNVSPAEKLEKEYGKETRLFIESLLDYPKLGGKK